MIMKPNPVGFHCDLTPSVMEEILSHVDGNYVAGQVARMAMIPKRRLQDWLARGTKDALEGNLTIFAQLSLGFEQRRGAAIMAMLEDVKERKTNWQAPWELLKTIAREEFGVEAVEYKELLELYSKLSEAFKRFTEQPIQQGALNNGREMDSQSD